jgi:hypothetical protein
MHKAWLREQIASSAPFKKIHQLPTPGMGFCFRGGST